MKTLVAFYSLDGNTKSIAEAIAEALGDADILEIKPKKELTSSFLKYFWGGRQAFMKEKPELLPLEKNANDYDIIFVGTPVWSWTVSPPIRSFISQAKLKGKKIALFCCYEGNPGKTFEEMKKNA